MRLKFFWSAGALAWICVLHISPARAATEIVLHNFGVTPYDGVFPGGGLTNVKGTLYGTTISGGMSTRCNGRAQPGCGIVFSITTRGKYKVLRSFKGGTDGELPVGNLVKVNGTLYGTTYSGGTGPCKVVYQRIGCGTVFSITPRGKETVIYSFKGGSDGYEPVSLVNVNGTLYGTTWFGGTGSCTNDGGTGCGTVFSIASDGTETSLYSFKGGSDGAGPRGALINVSGTLYGTTVFGGGESCTYLGSGSGCGTVFLLTTEGKEKVLYSFRGGHDGANPGAGLTEVQGTLYGTAPNGGGRANGGTVVSITLDGSESVLYAFGNGKHGGVPEASLLDVHGTLYGTGEYGGAEYHSGMVFSITTGGTEKVLHEFTATDGMFPDTNLINVNGTLYGTTEVGGSTFDTGGCVGGGGFGCGVVFSINP